MQDITLLSLAHGIDLNNTTKCGMRCDFGPTICTVLLLPPYLETFLKSYRDIVYHFLGY